MRHPAWRRKGVRDRDAIAIGLTADEAFDAARARIDQTPTTVPASRWILLPQVHAVTRVTKTRWNSRGLPRSERVRLRGTAWVLITSDKGAEVHFDDGQTVRRSLRNDPLTVRTLHEQAAHLRKVQAEERAKAAARRRRDRQRDVARRRRVGAFRRTILSRGTRFEVWDPTSSAWRPIAKKKVAAGRLLAEVDGPLVGATFTVIDGGNRSVRRIA